MNKSFNTPSNSLHKRQSEDKYLALQFIVKQVEKGTKLSFTELKKQDPEEYLLALALRYVTTIKKALCTAFNIPVEAGCRYKRELEKEGNLVQSIEHPAHLISTNPKEFERLLNSNTNQLNLFE